VSDSEGPSKTIKVVDRRRFTEDGSPRDPGSRDAATEPASEAQVSGTGAAGPGADPPPQPEPETAAAEENQPPASAPTTSPDFVELVAMLAQQAELILIGTDEMPAQPEQAKRLIDYLGALEAKTRGNLTDEEQRLLSNVVFELRTMFVQAKR
jgi:hypothetical protein